MQSLIGSDAEKLFINFNLKNVFDIISLRFSENNAYKAGDYCLYFNGVFDGLYQFKNSKDPGPFDELLVNSICLSDILKKYDDSISFLESDVTNQREGLKSVLYDLSEHNKIVQGHDQSIADLKKKTEEIGSHKPDWNEIANKPSTYAPAAHNQSWSTITDKPATYTPSAHNQSWSTITDKPATYAPTAHTHDDRYYTEAEVNSKINSIHHIVRVDSYSVNVVAQTAGVIATATAKVYAKTNSSNGRMFIPTITGRYTIAGGYTDNNTSVTFNVFNASSGTYGTTIVFYLVEYV